MTGYKAKTGGGGSRGEIQIETNELENCNGNLRKLKKEVENSIKYKNYLQSSRGKAKNELVNIMQEMKLCSEEFEYVIENTIVLFENIGVSFKETDNKAAKSFKGTKI